jgi:DNA-binding NtrC family response regulator
MWHGGCDGGKSVHTIFVVDDDPDQAQLLATALGADNRRVRAFSDPIRALAALTSEPADLLIADLSMPWLDGAQIVSTAREHQPNLQMILISGYSRGAEVAAAQGLRFFEKPIDLDRLRSVVDELLGSASPEVRT